MRYTVKPCLGKSSQWQGTGLGLIFGTERNEVSQRPSDENGSVVTLLRAREGHRTLDSTASPLTVQEAEAGCAGVPSGYQVVDLAHYF